MSELDELNTRVRRGIVQQICLGLEQEFGKPSADLMAVQRYAETLAKRIAGSWWRSIAEEAVRQWRLG